MRSMRDTPHTGFLPWWHHHLQDHHVIPIGQNEYVFPCVHILAVATVLHLHVNILELLELMLHAEW